MSMTCGWHMARKVSYFDTKKVAAQMRVRTFPRIQEEGAKGSEVCAEVCQRRIVLFRDAATTLFGLSPLNVGHDSGDDFGWLVKYIGRSVLALFAKR